MPSLPDPRQAASALAYWRDVHFDLLFRVYTEYLRTKSTASPSMGSPPTTKPTARASLPVYVPATSCHWELDVLGKGWEIPSWNSCAQRYQWTSARPRAVI